MRYLFTFFVLLFLSAHLVGQEKIGPEDLKAELPEIVLADVEHEIKLVFEDPFHPALVQRDGKLEIHVNDAPKEVMVKEGTAAFNHVFTSEKNEIVIDVGEFTSYEEVNPIPLWLSILPPLIAIIMALLFREVISSLVIGIFFGAGVIGYYQNGIAGIFSGLLMIIDTYVISALNDWGHLAVIIFSMLIGAIVAVISRNGGMQGVVDKISAFARDARSGQLSTWFLGIAIFFDDYANTLVVGNTMRPVTDRLKISREKLSYLVDSTAAPIAAIAFVTTWIGAELGYIESGIANIPEIRETQGVYSIFISSLQYSFYPIFTLVFMLILILKGRDFGPMYKAEVRARTTGEVTLTETGGAAGDALEEFQPVNMEKIRWINAVLPIAIVILGTIAGLFYTGWDQSVWDDGSLSFSRKLSAIIGGSDSYFALLWSSFCGLIVAVLLSTSQKIMNLTETVESIMTGFKTMLPAIAILILAWSLALVTEHLHTADFLTGLLSDRVSPIFIPVITFILSALVAFSTGSSWGTMAILYPLMLPATWQICQESGYNFEDSMMIFYNVVSCVLAGSVLGDHCSPISDTTILSSLASSCHHIDHVRTQLPYALTVGTVAILIGTLPGAMGVSSWIIFPVGFALLYLIVIFFGKKVES